MIPVDDVVQDTEDDDVQACAEEGGCDDGDDPVHGFVACPAEPEEADWDEEGAGAGHPHACFWDGFAVVLGDAAEVISLLEGGEGEGEERADGETEEGEALLADVEAVAVGGAEDEREGFVEEVDQAV